jgi:hypothetical protein
MGVVELFKIRKKRKISRINIWDHHDADSVKTSSAREHAIRCIPFLGQRGLAAKHRGPRPRKKRNAAAIICSSRTPFAELHLSVPRRNRTTRYLNGLLNLSSLSNA